METVCHTENHLLCYPDVTPGAARFAARDDHPGDNEIVRVTAHGLRRLLRIALKAQQIAGWAAFREHPDAASVFADGATPEKCRDLFQQTAAVWCEGNLVMSRLFVDKDGRAIRHKDGEVDEASIAPWERGVDEKERDQGS